MKLNKASKVFHEYIDTLYIYIRLNETIYNNENRWMSLSLKILYVHWIMNNLYRNRAALDRIARIQQRTLVSENGKLPWNSACGECAEWNVHQTRSPLRVPNANLIRVLPLTIIMSSVISRERLPIEKVPINRCTIIFFYLLYNYHYFLLFCKY